MTKPHPDVLRYGAPFVIGRAVVQALQAAEGLQGAVLCDNPVTAADLSTGDRVLLVEDQADKPRGDQPGQRARRSYGFALGVISRTDSARQDAHADYRLAKRTVLECLPLLAQMGIEIEGGGMVEGDVRYRIENIDVGGALVQGLFTLAYRDPA
ncbi:hypothetical protein AA671_15780 [Delftia tsuruhatensis]|jgi:hypothetical protein|uniref:Uncharacterized protein n=1 Tax=Delftia tsuruhatensis TaxID=180282 RepID=A0ABM6E324_9BURK|nr:hypothetical protein [Delftia tsuruhatensis]AOV01851.1 hypothetical protein BI380_11030 [Delftia tsuruhatensis]KLO58279.1 hypothetical protein AA671_15780 [Delftia tsuruhatensis]